MRHHTRCASVGCQQSIWQYRALMGRLHSIFLSLSVIACMSCEREQPSSNNIEAAYEVKLASDQERRQLISVLDQATRGRLHVDLHEAGQRPNEVPDPIKTVDAQVWKGAGRQGADYDLHARSGDAPVATIMDLGRGRVWLIFLNERNSETTRRYRDHVIVSIKRRWPQMVRLQQSKDGALPRMF